MDHILIIQASVEYINNHLCEKIGLDDLAKKACLSKYYYHRLFHKYIGKSVNSYINCKRMECAARELIETDQPIIEIALNYQYGSQEAFSRAFKRIYDVTPGAFRKKFGSNIIKFNSRANQITNIAA